LVPRKRVCTVSVLFLQKFILSFVFCHIYVTKWKTVDGDAFFDLTLTTGNIYFQEILSFHQYSCKNEQTPIALMIFFTDSNTASLKKLLQQPQSKVYRQDMISVFSNSKRRLNSSWQLRSINKERKYGYLLVRSRMGNKVRQTATWTAGFCQSIRNAKHTTRRSVILVKLLNLQKSLKTDLSEDFYHCSRYRNKI